MAERDTTHRPTHACLVSRHELLWLLRCRAGMTLRDGPKSHLTQVKWEDGRSWSADADAMLNDLKQRTVTAGIDIAWMEEAEAVPESSWHTLTTRKPEQHSDSF